MTNQSILQYGGSTEYGAWWVRLFGYGLQLKAPWRPLYFSGRYGYGRHLRVKGWCLRCLPRTPEYRQLSLYQDDKSA